MSCGEGENGAKAGPDYIMLSMFKSLCEGVFSVEGGLAASKAEAEP